eukprot:Em0016g784a
MQTFCMEAGVTAGAAAQAKMQLTTRNVSSELGWSCITLQCCRILWYWEAKKSPAVLLTSCLACSCCPHIKSKDTFEFYSRLNLALARTIGRAFMSRAFHNVDNTLPRHV